VFGYHTQVPEISGKLNGTKISFHMGHIIFAAKPKCYLLCNREATHKLRL
jgi:hypothetical protein